MRRSPKDLYSIIIECLQSVERKVDAAFAIVLDCIKLLADIDPILIHSYSETDKNIFDILSGYLQSKNHNLKYLGLVGISCIDSSFWKEEWLDGTMLGEIIRTSFEDDTIIAQAIENLDSIIDATVLKSVSPGMLEALSRNHDNKTCNAMIAYWLMNRIVEYHTKDQWFVEPLVYVLAETRNNLDDDYVETQCGILKEGTHLKMYGRTLT